MAKPMIPSACMRQCCLVDGTQDWDAEDLDSIPISVTGLLDDFMEVTFFLMEVTFLYLSFPIFKMGIMTLTSL